MLLNNIRNRLHTLTQPTHHLRINLHLLQLTHPQNRRLKTLLLSQLVSSRSATLLSLTRLKHIIKILKLSLIKPRHILRSNRRTIKITSRKHKIKRRSILRHLTRTLTKKTSDRRTQLNTLTLRNIRIKPLLPSRIPLLKHLPIPHNATRSRRFHKLRHRSTKQTATSTPNNNIRRHINHLPRLFIRPLLLLKHAPRSIILSLRRSTRLLSTNTLLNKSSLPTKTRASTNRTPRKRNSLRRNRNLRRSFALHRNRTTTLRPTRKTRTTTTRNKISPSNSASTSTRTLHSRIKKQRRINGLIAKKLLSRNPKPALLIRLV